MIVMELRENHFIPSSFLNELIFFILGMDPITKFTSNTMKFNMRPAKSNELYKYMAIR